MERSRYMYGRRTLLVNGKSTTSAELDGMYRQESKKLDVMVVNFKRRGSPRPHLSLQYKLEDNRWGRRKSLFRQKV
jgi:hypothetical protein